MKKIITAVLGGSVVATLAFASASLLTVDGGTIQAGQDNSLYCDADGVKANWGFESTDGTVRGVRISGIDAACLGSTIFVKTNGMTGDALSAEITGDQARVNFPMPYPTPESLESIEITIEG